jgi:hypothetical protein
VHRSERDLSDLLRSVGALLFATGAVVLLVRKSGEGGWSDFARVVVVFIPTAVLYTLALAPAPQERARPWQSVLAATATLLMPVVLFEFLNWVGANTRHVLYDALVFALTALMGGYAAARARATYAALLAALSFLVAWLLVWSKILDNPSANTYRWLIIAAAATLLLTAWRISRSGAVAAGEVATAGGLAAVGAGVFGVIVSSFLGAFHAFSALTRAASAHVHTSGAQHTGWDIYLLVVSLALAWLGARTRVRGLGYVAAIGVGSFIISAGAQITRLQSGRGPTHDVLVWPLLLVILGGCALLVSLLTSRTP